MKKNVSVFVLILSVFLSPQFILAQTGVDTDPVKSAENKKNRTKDHKQKRGYFNLK